MWAMIAEEANPPGRVAERDEILPEEADPEGRPIRRRQLRREKGRKPVLAHEVAHRGTRSDAGQQLVIFLAQHRYFPTPRLRAGTAYTTGPAPAQVRGRPVARITTLGVSGSSLDSPLDRLYHF